MKKVILILIDGMRPDGFMQCGNPYTENLLKSSTHTLKGLTVFPSDTLPCHLSLFTSAMPDQHNTKSNDYEPPNVILEGLIETLSRADKRTCVFYNWEELRDISRPGFLDFSLYIGGEKDTLITDYALRYIKERSPDFTFLYLGNVDMAGHDHTWMSKEYLETVSTAIDCTKRVIEELGDEYTYIITADHGGHEHDHGDNSPDDMLIPILCIGPDFEKNKEKPMSILDITPTIVDVMDVPLKECWVGKSAK